MDYSGEVQVRTMEEGLQHYAGNLIAQAYGRHQLENKRAGTSNQSDIYIRIGHRLVSALEWLLGANIPALKKDTVQRIEEFITSARGDWNNPEFVAALSRQYIEISNG